MRILNLSLFVIVADQLSKLWIKGASIPALGITIEGLQLGSSRPIIGDFLRLTYIENPGMAFGIDIGGKLFFSIFSILASIGILIYLYKARNENVAFRISLALILGGAVGNLIDRVFYGVLFNEGPLFYGRVVDFIDADFFNINFLGYHLSRWPVFNVADASVTCGVLLMLFAHRKSRKEESALTEAEKLSSSLGNTGASIMGAPAISPEASHSSPGSEPPQS
ncbi:MAG: signal peptidase II [Ignavibacteria bacterium]|nr:signal peptidase II [Ignavibacteria bacterium]MBI3765039.1 signal peptidase II [Ignavibacteriales bacterium]